MSSTKQPIQGKSLISSLISLFFKEIDNIIGAAAEYEEEMGVLKQVSRIPLTGKDGKQYELVIKLSPVRDKQGVFYVEAQCDDDNFDVSSMNGVAMKLNNRTLKQFNDRINEMIEKNGFKVNAEAMSVKEENNQSQDNSSQLTQEEAQKIVDEVQDKFKNKMSVGFVSEDNQKPTESFGFLYTTIELEDDYTSCRISMRVDPEDNSTGINIQPDSISTNVVQADQLEPKVKKAQEKYLNSNGLAKVTSSANASNKVSATLKKIAGSTELTLMAINAPRNIKAAMDMLIDIADDDEFIDSFADDEERSIEITDMGNEYNVEEIDEVDITPTYGVLFREMSYFCSTLCAARWAIGEIEWGKLLPICSVEWSVSNLLNAAAGWVVRHEGKYPTPQNPYSDCDYADFSDCEDESGRLVPECLQTMLLEDLNELVILLDNYYVNLEYDEQNIVANALNEFKRTLTYAR